MIGKSIGHYDIMARLGRGGMGEVFRARDTRLHREVAVKVLPIDFATDPDRLRRFEQEAKTLAALNHPNILTIHDAGVFDGSPYLIGELLEGKTLREEMAGGALPLRKATGIALQIARGLAAAHGKGVVHRDLKPENVFVTRDGRVKVLDFGLAKLHSDSASSQTISKKVGDGMDSLPTARIDPHENLNRTTPGMVLGTPGYMAPEQVRGEPADHRSDIFAFGCVLYEMLCGKRPFQRKTSVESMNAILNEEPPEFGSDDAGIPPSLRRIVRRCLEKEPDNRFQSARDLAFSIENGGGAAVGAAPAQIRSRILRTALVASTATALILILAGIALLPIARIAVPAPETTRSSAPLRKFELHLPSPTKRIGTGDELHPAISPDGRMLAYTNADGLWLRWLNSAASPTLLTQGENLTCPFWSPHSSEVGYFGGGRVMAVSIQEARARSICMAPDDASTGAAGGAWLTGDRIVFGTGWSGLFEVPAEGGKITEVDWPTDQEIDFHNPSSLPHGRGVLLAVHRTAGIDTIAVWTPEGGRTVLLQIPDSFCFYPVYSPSGHVVFQRSDDAGGLWAFPFSLERLERTGEPFRVSHVGTLPSVSHDGTLVYSLGALDEFGRRQLAWLDRSGSLLGVFGPALPGLSQQRLSPDGLRVVAAAGETISALDLWTIDVEGGGAISLARSPEMEAVPFWLDSRNVVFARREGRSFRALVKPADGAGEELELFDQLLAEASSNASATYLSRSGNYFFTARASSSGGITTGYYELSGPEREFTALPAAYQNTSNWSLSPDDHLLAYRSGESGRSEVYVVSFTNFAERRAVSRDGGRHPIWHPNGEELFYLTGDGRSLWSARLLPDGRNFMEPAKVFDLPESIHGGFFWWPSFYDVSPDGERFLMLQKVEDETSATRSDRPNALLVQNWFEEFRGRE